MGWPPPTRSISDSWIARSSLAWTSGFNSPISSRNSVPPSASSNFPNCWRTAPVNDPFSCPNSADSTSSEGMAARFTGMNGPSARPDSRWIIRASSSLPVPLSPRMRTVASSAATLRTRSRISRMLRLGPVTKGRSRSSATWALSAITFRCRSVRSEALRTSDTTASYSKSLVM